MQTASTALAGLALFLIAGAQEVKPAKVSAFDVQKLAWLAGTWELREGEKITEEHWFPFKGSTMMGVSHTYDSKATHFFEFLRIAVKGDTIAYVAQPGGSQPVPFLLKELDGKVAVFENPKHDHPQRIRYERTERGMTATISLLDGTRANSFVFSSKKE